MASLSGDWLSAEQMTAASEFKKFLQQPKQQADLAKAGFRAGDETHLFRLRANHCVRHLFRVASGLESMVVGETEIFGQVKRA